MADFQEISEDLPAVMYLPLAARYFIIMKPLSKSKEPIFDLCPFRIRPSPGRVGFALHVGNL